MDRKLKSSVMAEDSSGRQYHIEAAKGDVSRYVLLPGDPARADLIYSFWDTRKLVAYHREFKTYTGTYRGVPISVTSTGIGAPSTVIALEELVRIGADTFIRVGTMGAIKSDIKPGDLVIGIAAARFEGASKDYVTIEYPAVANYEVILSLIEAAELTGVRYHVGIVASTDTFYLGQSRPGYRGYMTSRAAERMPLLREAGVLGFEMEASAIFTVSSLYGARAGCVCAAIANRITNEFILGAGVREASMVANEAVRILYEIDKLKRREKKRWATISLLRSISL
jgi:uridine phosphorylase